LIRRSHQACSSHGRACGLLIWVRGKAKTVLCHVLPALQSAQSAGWYRLPAPPHVITCGCDCQLNQLSVPMLLRSPWTFVTVVVTGSSECTCRSAVPTVVWLLLNPRVRPVAHESPLSPK